MRTEKPPIEQASEDADAKLMLAVQANDAFAFEELMSRNQARVGAFLQRFVGNLQIAEDLTQEVFMRVYKHRETYRQEARFSTWLFRVARNVALNALRAKGRRPEALFSSVSVNSDATSEFCLENQLLTRSGSTPTRQIARAELQQAVRAAVDSLNPRQREAILLARFEGLSYQEIADIMNMSSKAVKSLLCRARINLKDALTSYVEEGRLSQ